MNRFSIRASALCLGALLCAAPLTPLAAQDAPAQDSIQANPMAPRGLPEDPNPPLPRETVVVEMAGQTFYFDAEIADEEEERRRGYMHRAAPGPEEGMLFDFEPGSRPSMFMANVSFPLDMLFIDEEGDVLAIVHQAQPGSWRSVGPGAPARAVLEIIGGRAAELGLTTEATVRHRLFDNVEPAPTAEEGSEDGSGGDDGE